MGIRDLTAREVATLAPLLLLTIYFGVHAQPIIDASAASIEVVVQTLDHAIATTQAAGL
jgi:NADH-quinone oxidoreductase subunit M